MVIQKLRLLSSSGSSGVLEVLCWIFCILLRDEGRENMEGMQLAGGFRVQEMVYTSHISHLTFH